MKNNKFLILGLFFASFLLFFQAVAMDEKETKLANLVVNQINRKLGQDQNCFLSTVPKEDGKFSISFSHHSSSGDSLNDYSSREGKTNYPPLSIEAINFILSQFVNNPLLTIENRP